MKNKKLLSLFVVSIMLMSLLTGCGASAPSYDNGFSGGDSLNVMGGVSADSSAGLGGIFDGFTSNKSESIVTDDYYAPQEPSMKPVETPETEIENPKENYLERKLVYTANIDAQTKDMTQAQKDINKMISDMGGYIESEYSYKNGGFDYGYTRTTLEMKIRVPSSKYQEFLSGLESENIYINNLNKSSTDYSTAYYDKESRINSLRIQEERLYELLANAQSVEVMLQIENQLANIRYEIESLTKEMRFIDSQVDYSTVNLNLEQVVHYDTSTQEPTNFFEELVETIKDSADEFTDWSKDALFAFIYMFPYLVILLIILLIVLKVRKKRKAKKIAKREEAIKQMNEITKEVQNNNETNENK